MTKCPHCGAEFQFDAKKQVVHCEYCGSDFDPNELETKTKAAKKNVEEELKGTYYSCTQCGATLMTFDETAITFCSYCGSQNMIEEKMMHQNVPEFIIPFSKTQEECIKNYKKKVSSFLFCPSYMKSDIVIKKFRGIYMPYGIYRLSYKGDCTNSGEKYNHRSGDYVYYDDYRIHADVDATYDGISFDLVSKYYDEYSHMIPFNYKEAVPFNPNYLPGYYADTKDVEIGTYSPDAIQIGANDSSRFLRKKSIYRKYNCNHPTISFHVEDKRVGMFPVYFTAIRDKSNENIHYAIINGQTGKVAMDLPIDFGKYLIFSVLLAIPIYILLLAIPIVLPLALNIFTIIASIIGLIICYNQVTACDARENRFHDKGVMAVKTVKYVDENGKTKKKRPKQKKTKLSMNYVWKYLVAILIPLLIWIAKPVQDAYYYVSASIGMIFILWSFYDLVKLHNRLTSMPIPQLNKRGGDESE